MKWEDRLDSVLEFWAARQVVPLPLVKGLALVESGMRATARHEGSGATGLVQVMHATAEDVLERPVGPDELKQVDLNLEVGLRYLRSFCWGFWPEIPSPVERWRFALASWNAGRGHIQVAAQLARLSEGQPSEYRAWVAAGRPEGLWMRWVVLREYVGVKPVGGLRANRGEVIPFVGKVELAARRSGGDPWE